MMVIYRLLLLFFSLAEYKRKSKKKKKKNQITIDSEYLAIAHFVKYNSLVL